MSLLVWRHICWQSLGARVLDAALSMIDKDRLGEQADRSLLASLVQMYIGIGLEEDNPVIFYRKEFRDPFIARTKEFYIKGTPKTRQDKTKQYNTRQDSTLVLYNTVSHPFLLFPSCYFIRVANHSLVTPESDAFLQQNSVSEYMKKAEQRLALEQNAAHQYLHPTTEPELLKACEEVLISRHNDTLQSEFQAMLHDDKEEDMKRFFGLLSRLSDGLNLSSGTMKGYLKNRGEGIVTEQAGKLKTKQALKNSVPLIDALLDLHKKYAPPIYPVLYS